MTSNTAKLAAAKKELRPLGVTIVRLAEWNEYRVNFSGGDEATACYTDDLDDAIGSARDMANRRNQQRVADRIDGFDRDDIGESPDF